MAFGRVRRGVRRGAVAARVSGLPRWARWAGGAVGGALVAAGYVWWAPVCHVLVPMTRPGWGGLPVEVRATAEAQFRLAAVQATAAFGGAVALLYTARTYRLAHRGQVNDRVVKALERLGSDEMYVRLGGVLALEQIVKDSPDQAADVAQVLNTFVRDRAPRAREAHADDRTGWSGAAALRAALGTAPVSFFAEPAPFAGPDADVQAALTALTRPTHRRLHGQRIDLSGLDLAGARLSGADLAEADLLGTDLTDAELIRANLRAAGLSEANLTNVELMGANLTNAALHDADLTKASLYGANLTDTFIDGTRLGSAVGLTAEQVTAAMVDSTTELAPAIAAHPHVIARIAEP